MKQLLTIIFLISSICCFGQIPSKSINATDIDMGDWMCLVAHGDGNGNIFTCDYNGHYFPAYIQDTTITKWFVKIDEKTKDSVFYYREYLHKYYVWDGKDKTKPGWYRYYGENKEWSESYQDSYKGDSAYRRQQIWAPKNIKN